MRGLLPQHEGGRREGAAWWLLFVLWPGLLSPVAAQLAVRLPAAVQEDKVSLRFEGLESVTPEVVKEWLGNRLDVVTRGEASPARADDAAFIVESFLRQRGFPEARVKGKVLSGSSILLTVSEGRLEKVRGIRVEGLDDDAVMDKEMTALVEDRLRAGQARREWIAWLPERLDQAVADANVYLRTRGYLEGQASGRTVEVTPDGPVVEMRVERGRLYQMAVPQVAGLPSGEEREVEESLAAFQGKPATAENLVAAQAGIEKVLKEQGFFHAGVYFSETHGEGVLQPVFEVEPGERFTFGTVRVNGLEKTRPDRAAEWFQGLGGLQYDESLVRKRVGNLLATGAYETVRSEAVPSPLGGNELDLEVQVEEGKARGVTAYAGAGSYEGFILGGSYFDRNWLGRLLNLNVSGELSGIGLLGETRVTNPRLFGTGTSSTSRLFTLLRQREGYGKWEAGFGFGLARELGSGWDLHLEFGASHVSVFSDGIPLRDLGPSSYQVRSVELVAEYENRDNPLAPSSGFYAKTGLEGGMITGDDPLGYLRHESSVMWLAKVSDESHLTLAAAAGIMVPFGDGVLPIDERFFLGGANSVRSFPERELGPKLKGGYASGGETYWHASLEYQHTLKGPLKGVVFTDAGALGQDFDTFGSDRVKWAAGLGLRLDLPIGPVRLEYGFNLNREDGEPPGALHFAIGLQF